MEKIAVIGAGSWGSALALVLSDNSHEVRLWTHNKSQAEEINHTHINSKYLPNAKLPNEIRAYHDLKQAVDGVSTVVLVVPTTAIREVCKQLGEVLNHKVTIIHGTKGIEPKTLKRVSEMIEEELPRKYYEEVVVLSGPSHAEEVSDRQPTTVTASSNSIAEAEKAQDLFINENFRVYTSPDMIGVELGGALKNIIALGSGISDGLGYGDNAKAALMTRGLAEIARLGTSMGANPLTFIGLAGVGDLIVTCTSVHSRNWKAGSLLGKGNSLDDVLNKMGMVVEGARTTKAAYQFSQEKKIEMPITNGIYRILFEEAKPKDVVDQLMTRMRRHEMEDLSNILNNKYSS
ncbi:NAD(P)H-dependent glycerol-3-phosphate dehydrogenase [Aquibacillus halophilus]|uniref:Glycerol-3-phosphate dehydrogenase [NAD(P)+] n=1 Tax=Aquibacillus halophilus TaxID=930132 RepID=A0A6A8DF42_9BACI|nr:NAD(P)H-dependent glycerol-3-phosphate dehydrogenase [Aquibacillus halophilus]MRH42391.1 NAD(P)H-dependent glycerol-3-phosphate dehydrogenase [Aquibacillus halophilus]